MLCSTALIIDQQINLLPGKPGVPAGPCRPGGQMFNCDVHAVIKVDHQRNSLSFIISKTNREKKS